MKLDDYLSERKMTEAEFGRLVGLSQSRVNRIRRGEGRPSWDVIPRIVQATKGKVTAADFIDAPQRETAQ